MNCNRDRMYSCGVNNFDNINLNSDNNRNNMSVNGRFPSNVMYGYAYVPFFTINQIFGPEEGLNKGTIFPELVQNYEPCDSMEEIMYLKGGRQNV